MPDLRGGIRRSKRINDNQESPAALAPTARRGAGDNPFQFHLKLLCFVSVQFTYCFLVYVNPLSVSRGRGRGRRAMNQDDNGKLAGPGACGRGCPGINLPVRQVVEKSAERLVAVEEEGSTSSLPERVLIFFVINLPWNQ